MRIYLAGAETWIPTLYASGLEMPKESRCLMTFLSADHIPKLLDTIDNYGFIDKKIALDSGGYSAMTRGMPINIKDYRECILMHQDRLAIAFNLDVGTTEDYDNNHAYLQAGHSVPVLPIVQLKQYYDRDLRKWADRTVAQYEYIAVGGIAAAIMGAGGTKRKSRKEIAAVFDAVFNIAIKTGTKVHGLGVTGAFYLERYPFYSCDSTVWIAGSKFGTLVRHKGGTMKKASSTNIRKGPKAIDEIGFILNSSPKRRVIQNAVEFTKYENYLTRLWAERGVSWTSE